MDEGECMEIMEICNGVSLENLNPMNFALKNEYFSNLVSCGVMVLPFLTETLDERIIVTRGFLSRSYILNNIEGTVKLTKDFYKHAEGLALEITWDGFDVESAITVSRLALERNECFIKCLINAEKKVISFFFDSTVSIILQTTSSGVRTVWTKPNLNI